MGEAAGGAIFRRESHVGEQAGEANEGDPERMRRRMAAWAPASSKARAGAGGDATTAEIRLATRPDRMRRVKWTLGGKAQREVVWTHSEKRRREEALRLRFRTGTRRTTGAA